MNPETWFALFIASWAISLAPGAGAVAAMSSGLRHGFRRGCWTLLGLQLGVLFQLLVIAVGLGAIIAASGLAFEIVRWLGAAYLCWLGIRQWRAAAHPGAIIPEKAGGRSVGDMLLHGFLVNASNPKATIFMLAVLPQFIDVAQPLLRQYLIVVATMTAVDLVVMGGYAGFAARALRLLREPRHVRWVNRVFGSLFVAAAALLAGFRRAA
ncbi:MAG TPA: LysE family transporter [Burkholderiales bacterium]|nr:LysE family transporter [Burkholderiales bacterium]